MTQTYRQLIGKTQGIPASDGAGVRLTRIIGSPQVDYLDPFLMLDYFESTNPNDYIAGFPPHPHRGFETVTYLLAGKMRHKDNKGHEGLIEAGGVQWMTAGKGIIHSEMPEQEDGLMMGFQLWVNLPSHAKMVDASYQEFSPSEIAVENRDSSTTIKVITGQTSQGTVGPVKNNYIQPLMIDVQLEQDNDFTETLDSNAQAFIYLISGSLKLHHSEQQSSNIQAKELAVLSNGDTLKLTATKDNTRFLLVAAQPINEPIARGGPFVMNTQAEIEQAFSDYKNGQF
ncbi:pirin family protein [Thiomicrorhabdus lithotrophica]|uniref:Pirin family protein n=1 Tax=Thiomicrorhabdus lithotrophica TaxID=2949997 RepID=A0ABY8C6M8_9GAMM|nr:pirin family protein [Thiomicrorhabdus lithotrophica]WEJ61619.1 pirin family protein [Thiomicrorhabdus lithotrophica]